MSPGHNMYSFAFCYLQSKFKQSQQNLSRVSALLSSEKDSEIVMYHFVLSIIVPILKNGVSILNSREIFRSGKIGEEETFYVHS